MDEPPTVCQVLGQTLCGKQDMQSPHTHEARNLMVKTYKYTE